MLAEFVEFPHWITPFVIPGLPIRWYAVMYLVAFGITYVLFRYQCTHDNYLRLSSDESQTFFFYGILFLLLFRITDTAVAAIPLGYTFGRLGNFINAELYGRVTEVPWGMVFPTAPPFSTNEEWVRKIADRLGFE